MKDNTSPERKQMLIDALKAERKLFESNGHCTLDHDVAIEYLETGFSNKNPDVFELLDACMNDLDCMASDYLD